LSYQFVVVRDGLGSCIGDTTDWVGGLSRDFRGCALDHGARCDWLVGGSMTSLTYRVVFEPPVSQVEIPILICALYIGNKKAPAEARASDERWMYQRLRPIDLAVARALVEEFGS